MKDPTVQVWHAVYRKQAANHHELIALFKVASDAEEWHANPDVYANTTRQIRIAPAPIEVEHCTTRAIGLLDAIVNGPDETLFERMEEAKAFLASTKAMTE